MRPAKSDISSLAPQADEAINKKSNETIIFVFTVKAFREFVESD